MATFSPSPAPKRSSRLRPQRGSSPPRRTRAVPGSDATSRVVTPVQPMQSFPYISGNPTVASMDVDETGSSFGANPRLGGDVVFARSNEMLVTFYANLPVEVKQVLKNTDFYKVPFIGAIDTLTGFAVVASAQTCFVWQHAQAIRGIPTCYIFSSPRDLSQMDPPFHALIPHGPSREPGLILVSPSGEVRFWDSIGIGLAGGEHYVTTHLALKEEAGEQVNNLVRSDAQTFVVSTTGGNLFRLTLTSTGGKYHLASRSFSRPIPTGSFSRLFPSIFSSSSSHHEPEAFECIYSVALGEQTEKGDKDIWAIARRRVQKWVLKAEGWEEFQFSFDLADVLEPVIESKTDLNRNLDLELLDAAVDRQVNIVNCEVYADYGVRRIYTLALVSAVNGNFEIEDIKTVPYQSTFISNVNVHARIQLLFNGSMTSIQFGDAVALCSRNSEFQDRLELKSLTDRVLGVGVNQADSSLLILTANTMMKTDLDLDKINMFDPTLAVKLTFSHSVGRTNLIKSIMTQAILFGSLPENPLHFSFPPEVDEESLMQGAEQLSEAVLRSDPEVVRRNHDLSSQLTGRKERLSWLIQFINDNAVLGKMAQQSRQRLATDAEKLYACQQLWIQYNEMLRMNPSHSVLHDCVLAYMSEVGDGQHEDVMRAFFRLHAADIGLLIRKVLELSKVASGESGISLSHFLPEANSIVVTALRSSFDYRACNLGVYGIELPMIKPWTSRPAVIDVVLSLFDASTKTVEPSATEHNSKKEPYNQLPELASVLFECIQERIDWLGSSAAANDQGASQGLNELVQRFDLLRPEVLETLRRIGHEEAAFALAEKYRDFSSLAALCHRDVIYPLKTTHMQPVFKVMLTDLKTISLESSINGVFNMSRNTTGIYIDRYFSERKDNGISWIYDLGHERYGTVATSMLSEARKASNLEAKHLMLSIGKLSHLAQLQDTNADADEAVIDANAQVAFHDELDFVSVLEALAQGFRSALEGVRGRHSLDGQIDIIMKAKASRLGAKKTMSHVFKDILRQLLQGKALSIEDAIDLLTLKDNVETFDDYVSALHLLARVAAIQLPDSRKVSAFRTVWRRIYIHDDWEAIQRTANVSDDEVIERYRNTAAYATLCACTEKRDTFPGLAMTPNEALQVPSRDEIASRWPGMSSDQVEGVMQDYNLECDTLGELNLQDVYFRLQHLAEQNTWEGL
ncbi:hypothetical protein BDQ17DRAFT_1320576 [Cyathus striatus]|nr:hypothetical protein BDQ17DRAFT_1320576 [Cyathus striatus]